MAIRYLILLILLTSCTTSEPIFKVDAGYSKYFVYPEGRTRQVGDYRFNSEDCPKVELEQNRK